jgi:hypothetical protein
MPDEAQQEHLGSEVLHALRTLRRGEELTSTLRPSSRAPGFLHWSWAPVTTDLLRQLTGSTPLRLPARLRAGQQEVLAVRGRDGEPDLDVDENGRAVASGFAAFYLPRHLDWRAAQTSSVLRTDVTAIYVHEADDRPWPLSMLRRRSSMTTDDLPPFPVVEKDFTVVEVDGAAVGVQADLSGAVSVGWSVSRPPADVERRWNVWMLTRRSAVDAVRLVRDAGLLQ